MKQIKSKEKAFFYDYYELGDDTKRLTLILLIFAFLLCPFFAFLFNILGAPEVYFYTILSATFVFPLILLLERIFPFLRNKLPLLYFLYFNAITLFVIYELVKVKFKLYDFVFFIGLFSVLNFAVQRFYYSLIYFLNSILFLGIGLLTTPKLDETSVIPIFNLVVCIGLFSLVIYYSRNKMVNTIQDHNTYLKRIVNNLGTGVAFFQLKTGNISVIDFNMEVENLLDLKDVSELESFLAGILDNETLGDIEKLEKDSFYSKETTLKQGKIIELKISRVMLKNGIYYVCAIQDITIKTLENKLIKENEKKYKNLFVRNLTALFTINMDGQIVACNPAFLRLFDYQEMDQIKLFSEEEWSKLREKIVNNEILTNYNKVYNEDTDTPKYAIFNFYYDYENKTIEGNILDATEITLSTKALQENENKYRVIYEGNNDSIILLDHDRIVDINQQGLKLFGKNENELLEKSLWDFTYQQTPQLKKVYDSYFERLKKDKKIKFTWLFSNKKSYIEASLSIIELNLGEEVFYQCVIRDETEINKNIRALENSKKTFETIIENTPEGFLVMKGGACLFANTEFFRLFETNEQTPDKISLEQLFAKNHNFFLTLVEEHASERKIKQKVLKFDINGKQKEIELTLVSIIFEQQEALMVIMKDISMQNMLSKEVLRAEVAEEANKRLEMEIEERKKVEERLESEYLRTKAIFDSSENTLLFTLDENMVISSFNNPSKTYFGYQTGREMVVGISFEDFFQSIISPIKLRYFRYLLSGLRKGKSYNLELKFINIYNEKKWFEIYLNPIFDINGQLVEISLVSHDITEKKSYEREILNSLKEKEVLLKEVHHRVKNNLQIISSILNLQSSYIDDEKILEIIEESRHRIRSMAIIHENLYQTTNFSSINFKNYSNELVRNLISSYSFNRDLEIEVKGKVEQVDLSLDQAIPCGLIINEIITNSMKYAFLNMKKGIIYLELKEKNSNITLVVGDNGVGLPKEFNIHNTETLGLQLVITLVEQLGGIIEMDTTMGIKYFITFEKQKL